MRALLVDDDSLAGRFAQGVLRRIGIEVDWVTSAREGLEAGSSGRYDLLLLDLGLPEVPGLVVARTIRAYEAELGAPRMRIIALTAADPDPVELAAYGIDSFIPKPFSRQKATDLFDDLRKAG